MSTEKEKLDELRKYYDYESDNECINISDYRSITLDQIVLIRHGQPDVDTKGIFTRRQAAGFLEDYDKASIKPFKSNPICVNNLAPTKIYHSPLPRAKATAQQLFKDRRFTLKEDARFREFERKIAPLIAAPMNIKYWTTLSRLFWYSDIGQKGVERVRQARKRAMKNASYLAHKARKKHTVFLVAHGLHNRAVMKFLKKKGWKMVHREGHRHLALNILAKHRE